MTYRVVITDAALADVEKFLDYLEFEKKAPLPPSVGGKKRYTASNR